LERLCRPLHASLVVSQDVLLEVPGFHLSADWQWKDAAELDGRRGKLKLAYLPRIRT